MALLAGVGVTSLTGYLLADEPRVMFNASPYAEPAGTTQLKAYQEPANTQSLKWRSRSGNANKPVSVTPVRYDHTVSNATGLQPHVAENNSEATMIVDGQVRPVAFALELNPANAPKQPRVRTVAGPAQSVLKNRQPEATAQNTSPFQNPFGDKAPTPARIDLQTVQEPGSVLTNSQGGVASGGDLQPSPTPAEPLPAPAAPENSTPLPEVNPQTPFQPKGLELENPTPKVGPVLENDTEPAPQAPAEIQNPRPAPMERVEPMEIAPNRPRVLEDNEGKVPEDFQPSPLPEVPPVPRTQNGYGNGNGRKPFPCKDNYNGLNPCKELEGTDDAEKGCHIIRAELNGKRISDYTRSSLDISPRFQAKSDSIHEIEKDDDLREQHLRQAGKREWKNKDNQPLVYGRLMNLREARAIIQDENGNETPVPVANLSDDDLAFISGWYQIPMECSLGNESYNGRQFACSTFTWKASGICHKPLYFEQVQLERYGHSAGPIAQPVISGAHFFANIALLPYHMGVNPPNECQYALGYYRPGSCAPYMIQPWPLSARGAMTQAGFVLGGIAIIP